MAMKEFAAMEEENNLISLFWSNQNSYVSANIKITPLSTGKYPNI
jgi:hypothetical protein